MANDKTMKRPERDKWLERIRRDGDGRSMAMRRLIHTCNDLAAQRDKAAKLMTDDGLYAGQQLSAAKSSNKRLREENMKLRQLLAGVLGDETVTYCSDPEIEAMLRERIDGFIERHAALIESMFGDAFVEVDDD